MPQFTLDGEVLTDVPTPLCEDSVEDAWIQSYANALLSGEVQVKFDPEPSPDLAQAMYKWAEMTLDDINETANADIIESVQRKLETAAAEEKLLFGPMSAYYIAKVAADRKKNQQEAADESVADGSSTNDSFLEPPNDDLAEGANMDRFHYVNLQQDHEDDAHVLPNLAQVPAEVSPAAQASTDNGKCVDSCRSESGKLFLMQGATKFTPQDGAFFDLSHLEPCPSHKFKRWVIALVVNMTIDSEDAFKEVVDREGFGACPFFMGCNADGNETYIIYQSSESDKHKVKALSLEGVSLRTFKKSGGQSQKIIETIAALKSGCKTYLTNLEVRTAEAPEGDNMSYEQALDTVADWGVDRLTAFIENAKLKKTRDQKIEGLEGVCLVSKASLMEVVKLRQDAGEFVFYLGTERQRRDCPKTFDDGATDYAKNLKVCVWSPSDKQFNIMTLRDWLDSEEHLMTALLLLGEGGKGKSKLSHMLAQELAIGYTKELYVLAKAMDPLGILSHTGVFKKAGALIIADADFKTTKGPMTAEEVKSVFDITEGGTVQGTRYRPANFPGGGELPRIFNMNASPSDMGKFFRKHDMHGIAMVLDAVAENNLQKAADQLKVLDADTGAQVRRFAIALDMDTQALVTEDTIATLRANAKERAQAAKKRRMEYHGA